MTAYVVAIDHPSLQLLVGPFVDDLRGESRRFDRISATNPKPFPSLVRKVTAPTHRRFGVIDDGVLVGMGSLSDDGEVAIAMAASHRGIGLGSMLLAHIVDRARLLQYSRLVMESSRRSSPVSALADRFGWSSYELGRGRVELVLELAREYAG